MPTKTNIPSSHHEAIRPHHKERQAKAGQAYKMPDGDGMYCYIQPNGGKYWRYDYRFNGKRKTLALGTYPTVSLKKAREKLEAARDQLAIGLTLD